MIGNFAALKAAHNSTAMMTSPMAPMVVGLREAKERPRGAFFSRSRGPAARVERAAVAISHTSPAGRTRSG